MCIYVYMYMCIYVYMVQSSGWVPPLRWVWVHPASTMFDGSPPARPVGGWGGAYCWDGFPPPPLRGGVGFGAGVE